MGITISNSQGLWLEFSLRNTPHHLWVMIVYIVWVQKCVSDRTLWQNRMFCECLAGRPYPRATRKTQLSPSILTLHIPVMCRAHVSFRKMLSRELLAKTLQSSICLSLHALSLSLSLSLSQPLQLNPTINIGYKRLNKITIKVGTKLKLTKHIVVNYNFTLRELGGGVSIRKIILRKTTKEQFKSKYQNQSREQTLV